MEWEREIGFQTPQRQSFLGLIVKGLTEGKPQLSTSQSLKTGGSAVGATLVVVRRQLVSEGKKFGEEKQSGWHLTSCSADDLFFQEENFRNFRGNQLRWPSRH